MVYNETKIPATPKRSAKGFITEKMAIDERGDPLGAEQHGP